MISHRHLQHFRRAMTMVELLVVVAILVVLIAVAVPLLQPSIRSGQIREAARSVNVYLASARSRAIQKQRDVGVRLHRTASGQDVVTELSIIESPPAYIGDIEGELGTIRALTSTPGPFRPESILIETNANAGLVVKSGDRIQLGDSAILFDIDTVRLQPSSPPSNGVDTFITFVFPTADAQVLGAKKWYFDRYPGVGAGSSLDFDRSTTASPKITPFTDAQQVRFKIYRQPIPAPVKPLQLSGGACIDLRFSGVGPGGRVDPGTNNSVPPNLLSGPIDIVFSPAGHVSCTYYESHPSPVVRHLGAEGNIYLLVGRAEQVLGDSVKSNTATISNLQDGAAMWVGVNCLTGSVTTGENDPYTINSATGNSPNLVDLFNVPSVDLAKTRSIVRSGESTGGK